MSEHQVGEHLGSGGDYHITRIKMAKIVAKLLMPKLRGQLVKRSSRVDLVNVANLGNIRNRISHSSPLQSYEIPPSDSSRVPCLDKAVK